MVTYPKKQIQPLIDKYAINPETNTVFHSLIEEFEGKPNYQTWAVKVVFSRAVIPSDMYMLIEWSKINPELIKSLSKNGNLICYTTREDFANLFVEVNNLSRIKFVKSMISRLNTDQRKIVSSASFVNSVNSTNAHNNDAFMRWLDIFTKFDKKSEETKKNVVHRISAERDSERIFKLLSMALSEKYEWNHDDLLSFIENNTQDCKVVFDKDNIVLVNVPAYESAKKLCYGETKWCICNDKSTFDDYVTDYNRKQYFYFDFNKPKDDELSHVGFTVSKDGITHAHATDDGDLVSGIYYKDSENNENKITINDVLKNASIKFKFFMNRPKNTPFVWSRDSCIKFASKRHIENVYDKDNIVILKLNGASQMEWFYDDNCYFRTSNGFINYVVFNFNVDADDDESMILLQYNSDKYGSVDLYHVFNTYNMGLPYSYIIDTFGISERDFINTGSIDHSILLHKYIDQRNEKEAIRLMREEDDVDVNYMFESTLPIFSAISNNEIEVVKEIVNNKNFDYNAETNYGESVLLSLIYATYRNSSFTGEFGPIDEIIKVIVNSESTDLNYIDISNDTLVNVAATSERMLWLLEMLLSNPNVDVNVVNCWGVNALGNAISHGNFKGANLILSMRKDIQINEKCSKLAIRKGFDLHFTHDVESEKYSKSYV